MVSKRTIIGAVEVLNMDQCELASRIANLEKKVESLEKAAKVKPAKVKVLNTAPKGRGAKEKAKKKVGRPRK